MTTEEKAKAYDETVERIAMLLGKDGTVIGRYWLEKIFPQLAESEDEKIRKWIKKELESKYVVDNIVNNMMADKAFAYLEKQKERGPLTKKEEYILHRIIEYLEDETCPSEWISLLHDIYCLPYGKQKEQKPVILGPDETEFPYNHPANTLEGEIKNIWSKLSSENAFVASFEGFREVIIHFVNFVQKVQKPAEWSEEEEKDIQEASDYLRDYANNCVQGGNSKLYIQSLADRIESLRPQHQSPSLSDKEILCLKRALDYLRKEHNRYGGEDFTNEIAVLEYLITHPVMVYPSQPHWKPSEEQMQGLRRGIVKADEGSDAKNAMVSLYNDLKKL